MPVDSVPPPAETNEVLSATDYYSLEQAFEGFQAAYTINFGAELHLLTEYTDSGDRDGASRPVYRLIVHRWAPAADGSPDPV